MSDLKRLPVKYIRDYIKKDYKYDSCCYICGGEESLELHHLYSVSELWNLWLEKNPVEILDFETIKTLREQFYIENKHLLDERNLYTLCKNHHQKLHSIYGARYSNWRSGKVKQWLEVQKIKFGEQNGQPDIVD